MDAVLRDLDTAPIEESLRATLRFLRKVTLEPDAVGAEDARTVLDTGVSPAAMRDALYVCAHFNLINRLADAFGFSPAERYVSHADVMAGGAMFLERGYVSDRPNRRSPDA